MKHFTVRLRGSKDSQFFLVLTGLNGEDVFVQETNKSKQSCKKLASKWFPGCVFIDETLKRPRKSGLNIILP